MIKFELQEKIEGNKLVYGYINRDKDCLNVLKQSIKNINAVEIDYEFLGLNRILYGENKEESVNLQKENCKIMLELYKICVKFVKLTKKYKVKFGGIFYVKGLKNKTNNNDFMLEAMLHVKFNVSPFKRLSMSYKLAADYLDKENSINSMCDFKNNQCVKHRETNNLSKTTGCCSKIICKYTCNGPCPVWNMACKVLMCDYLINKKGYYFTPHTIPILKLHFSYIERCFSIGQLCRSSKKAIFELWFIRGISVFLGLVFFGFGIMLCL